MSTMGQLRHGRRRFAHACTIACVGVLWLASPTAHLAAQVRIDPFPSAVTASGPPLTAWFVVHNEGPSEVELTIAEVHHLPPGAPPVPLRVLGREIDDVRGTGPFRVPAHGSVRLVVLVSGFGAGSASAYEVSLRVCTAGTETCVTGQTRITRAHRDPVQRKRPSA